MLPTVQQFETIKQFFASHAIDPKCSICASDEWAIEDILEPADAPGPRILKRGAAVPLVQFECRRCGHVVFFNAGALGISSGNGV